MRLAAVMVGGAAGALARWAVELAIPSPGVPAGHLRDQRHRCVRARGGRGGPVGAASSDPPPAPAARDRVLGAYTTFSTMAMEGVRLLDQGRPGMAVGYWLATLLVGQMAGVYGMWLGRLRLPRRRDAVERRGHAAADLHR